MARTFISQPNQVFSSETYDDTLPAGSALESASSNLESDLNALRSQLKRVLWADADGSWYDAISAPSGSGSSRGLNAVNVDLSNLEQKRFLFRKQVLNIVEVATGSNFAPLSVALGTAPEDFAVVYHPAFAEPHNTGSLVALLSGSEGSFGSHSLAQASGSTSITPKNLVVVRDAWTGLMLTASNGRDVYGLLQVEDGTESGDSFGDSSNRAQLSFVHEAVINQTASLVAADVGCVGGRSVNYSYTCRTALDNIPEDAYLSNTMFLDLADALSGNFASLYDVTLDRALDNQVGIASMDHDVSVRIAAGSSWTFMSGASDMLRLTSDDSGNSFTVDVDQVGVTTTSPAAFSNGVSVATGSIQVNVGVVPGTIQTLLGADLILSGGSELRFGDVNAVGSTVPMSTAQNDWTEFHDGFGAGASLLGALNVISASLSGSLRRSRYVAGVMADVGAGVNVTFPTNLDAQVGSYVGRDFGKDVEVYLNGILLRPGTALGEQNDVYPGDSPATGDLKFPYTVRSGSQLTVTSY